MVGEYWKIEDYDNQYDILTDVFYSVLETKWISHFAVIDHYFSYYIGHEAMQLHGTCCLVQQQTLLSYAWERNR